MGCRMTKKTAKRGKPAQKTQKQAVDTPASEIYPDELFDISEIENMKRVQLQKLCKQFGIKASGKNVELISRLQEYHNKAVILGNIKEQQLSQEFKEVVGVEETDKGPVDNVTFEIADSRIPVDQHVHVSKGDNNSHPAAITKNCDAPEDTAQALQHYGQPDDKMAQVSDRVLKELNYASESEIKAHEVQAQTNTCGKWCVVEGLLKQENKSLWHQIYLVGGKPVVSNRFGKRVPFVLEPCGLATPNTCEDNFICGSCVRENETLVRCQGIAHVENSVSLQHDLTNSVSLDSEASITCSTPSSFNHRVLSSFSRVGSVKRKRCDDHANSSFTSSIIDSDQIGKKRRKDSPFRPSSGTPASPQVRRARGEQLVLPRHLQKPWLPKKKTKPSKAAVKEDTEFARRVEEIIKNTQPGSEEEMAMIMFSKSSKIQRSPKNST